MMTNLATMSKDTNWIWSLINYNEGSWQFGVLIKSSAESAQMPNDQKLAPEWSRD